MAIDWTKKWAASDAGTIIGGNHLSTLQDDIDAGFEQALSDALSVALPSQVGNSGKLLTTNGTDASWAWPVLDEDDMASNSAVSVCSQQSIKAYVDASSPALGNWAAVADQNAHQATTDGFLVAYGNVGPTGGGITAYTDANASPTTIRAYIYTPDGSHQISGSLCVPVKKNDYYKIVTAGTGSISAAFFIPLS